MPYRPSQRKHNSRTVTLKVNDGGRFSVTYLPGAIDAETMHETRAANAEDDLSGAYAMAARIITAWELEDDDGQTIPPTVEAMEAHSLDFPLVNWILEQVLEDAKPGETKLASLRRG